MGNSATYFKEVFQITEQSPSTPSSPAVVDVISDPRSPTAEFARTPIEVGMPIKRFRRRNRTMSEVALDYSEPMSKGSYLKSEDIDDEHDLENVSFKFHKLLILHKDPRSPTAGIIRTPIQVAAYNEQETDELLISPVDSMKTCISMEALVTSPDEPPVSESSQQLHDPRSPSTEVVRTPIQVPVWNDEEHSDSTHKATVMPSSKKDKENKDCLAKKLFGTPELKDSPLQVRTPLRTMTANENSPYQMLRVKQSRGVNKELGRLCGIENTPPPCLNKYDLASTKRKIHNSSSQWSHDNTIII